MSIQFYYAVGIHQRFPQLQARALFAEGINANAVPSTIINGLMAVANHRLSVFGESEFPEIQAWRRAFSTMGLKPTQYRCASEALLRRYRKDGELPKLHPLIDLCNSLSLAYAIPVAVFDLDRIEGNLCVRFDHGDEAYESFSGEIESPEQGEVIFADDARRAHARRWTNRQSGWSAVQKQTERVLIVAEALHDDAGDDVAALMFSLVEALRLTWPEVKLRKGSVA